MSEDSSQEKTEQPTEKRLKKAKKDGQVARSKELNTAILLMVGISGLLWFANLFYKLFADLMSTSMQLDHNIINNTKMMPIALAQAVLDMLSTLTPFLLLMFIAMWITGCLPGGFVFSMSLVAPKFSKLNPLKGLAKMFGIQSLVELVKSILKISLLAICLYTFLTKLWMQLMFLQNLDVKVAIGQGIELLFLSLMITVTLLLFIAVIDVPFQQHQISKKIKMTHQEVKEERKSSDGSPEIKNKIRQIQFQQANRKVEERVPTADVIITNPTHYAVAIKYSESAAKAPYVVAKGVDEMALRIREVARQNNKEVIELPALARAIYFSTRIDQEVPNGLYTAVAYVLTYVMQLKAYKQGRGQPPAPLPKLKIPKNLQKS
ncbi:MULTISPECIES: flagellar biosynthesis protein FlhB [Pseudoalteromonas]|jgi:flagellar biosynthetic protein FlhB|uniref:Flagellar biosynthetic protein FlhB n=2 Tax=Pseudoalteromonas aliena TaxID=247523 RepID=A0A1Q2H3G0_9GAMM|nr:MULTISPECIES: flagellar biosynthesis protein FlhB [Pseudoalteromonas]AQQ01902.1 flagellar biosynthesis protein FlhB [Pseudoalteromonas aliena]MBB1387119.1 flagellar biosynthesis protein FlhB [Pseudoalteromonas sp. SG45-5]MBB1395222.1 flagellar biosynthesis protein FlhB [Pseudoalteromonas sp. SG44-4]MBB1447258.1 flagellar biosynthesis protein FlhB [Pseudoalteromonas sp. SG41-6]MBE0359874.1 flagellar biosynthetic protein FlhB [Pseudoalteromonas aliena SW19]